MKSIFFIVSFGIGEGKTSSTQVLFLIYVDFNSIICGRVIINLFPLLSHRMEDQHIWCGCLARIVRTLNTNGADAL